MITRDTTGPFRAHGFVFEVSSPVAELLTVVDDVFVDMRADAIQPSDGSGPTVHRVAVEPVLDGARRDHRVTVDGEIVHETLIEGSVLSHVLMEVNRRATETVWASGSIALHASVVAGPAGAVVLAGTSHSGKTTLATALTLAGAGRFTLLADEVCALDPSELTVAPYPKPAALRTPGRDLLAPRIERLRRAGSSFEHDERFVPPHELGGAPTDPCPVVAVIFPRYVPSPDDRGDDDRREDVARPRSATIVPSRPADALTRLMRLTLGDQPPTRRVFQTLEHLVRTVVVADLDHGDALVAAAQLAHLVEGATLS